MKAPTEQDLVRQCLRLLQLRGVFCWRNNTGVLRDARNRPVRFGAVGSADILGVLRPDGRLLALELKRPGRKPTPPQEAWLEAVRQAGGVALVVTDVADLDRALKELGVW